jgi:hypothetical protein
MNKKLGIILMSVGAYTILIGGLVWIMHFSDATSQSLVNPWDWIWGLMIGIYLIICTVFASKGYIIGLIGHGLAVIGIGCTFALLAYGVLVENYLSIVVLLGLICSIAGLVISLVFHIINMIRISKHGNSLL